MMEGIGVSGGNPIVWLTWIETRPSYIDRDDPCTSLTSQGEQQGSITEFSALRSPHFSPESSPARVFRPLVCLMLKLAGNKMSRGMGP